MSYYSTYRWCAVPECKNTSVKAPHKLWIQVPIDINMRKIWFKVARRDPKLILKKTRLYFCEDHFNLEEDMENYIRYKIMGTVKKIRLKQHCIPSRFDWNRKLASNESKKAKTLRISKDSVKDHIEENTKESFCIEDTTQEAPECSASKQSSPTQDKTFERLKDVSRVKRRKCITDLSIEDKSFLTNTSENEMTARVDPLSDLQESLGKNGSGISMASTFAQSALKRERDGDVISSASEPSGLHDNVKQTPSCSRTSDFHNNKILEYRIKLEDEIGDDDTEAEQPIFQVNIDMDRDGDLHVKDVIKVEYNCLQCNICLSVGRKMYPIDRYSYIYKKLLYDSHDDQENNTFDTTPTLVCWECNALLRSVEKFQNRIRKANEMIQTKQNIVSLSSLTTVVISDSNPETIYLTRENTEHQMNTENDDLINCDVINDDVINCDVTNDDVINCDVTNDDVIGVDVIKEGATALDDWCIKDKENPIEDSDLKIRNKWAKKRVLINKELKFRKVKDQDLFKKVSFSIQLLQDVLEECRNDESYKSSEFKCLSCVRRFDDQSDLIEHNHRQHHETVGSYSCDICRSRFTDVQTLSNHLFSHYHFYYCKLCDYKCYNEEDKMRHARAQHRTEAYECLKCGRLFNNRRKFYEHYKLSHETYICDYCGVKYKLKDSLITHIRKKHTKRECTICKKKFKRYNSLWLHNRLHRAPAAAAYCVECDTRFADEYRYKCHLANSVKHTPRKAVRIPCPDCGKPFTKKINMQNHYDLVHLKLVKFKCDLCPKYFVRNADVRKHRRRVHDGIQPPKDKMCHICGQGFTTNQILAKHIQRKLACAHRSASFTHKRAVTSHDRET